MITSTLLSNLKLDLQVKNKFTIDQLITNILLGTDNSKSLEAYEPDKVYNTGDKLPYVTKEGELLFICAITDNITGPFNPKDWEEWDVLSELSGILDDYIILSWNKPSLRRNKVWLEVKEESVQDAREVGIGMDGDSVMVYNNLVVSARKPTMAQNVIWGAITEVIG